MRPTTNQQQWIPSARTPPRGKGPTTTGTKGSGGSPKSPNNAASMGKNHAEGQQEQTPIQVRIRNTAPPDPELLSKIGCRCLVIDFPGVLYENIAVSCIGGFIRVEGKRTVGRIKSFRKKFPINHDQVVTRMLSAFLCQGVLVIVAPTKVAAAMAAAAIVAAQLLAKGYSIRTKSQFHPPQLKMLTQYANKPRGGGEEEEVPVSFSNSIRGTSVATTTTSGIIDFRKNSSAFTPYVASKRAVPLDVTGAKSVPFDEEFAVESSPSSSSSNRALKNSNSLIPKTPNNQHTAPAKSKLDDRVEDKEGAEENINVSPPRQPKLRQDDSVKQSPLVGTTSPESTVAESYSSSERTQEPEKRPTVNQASHNSKGIHPTSTSDLSLPESEKPAVWSDDSLRDEPSMSATKTLPVMESLYVDNIRDARISQLSPILENPYSDASYSAESPDNSSGQRPLAWVQFDSGWQEKEESLMVDTAANHKRVEQLHQEGRRKAKGTNVKVGVPIMLPSEDELANDINVESHYPPLWRPDAPFLPTLFESDPLSIDRYSVDARALSSYHNHKSYYQYDAIEHGNSPNRSLRRKEMNTASSPAGGKHVTWIDEFGEI